MTFRPKYITFESSTRCLSTAATSPGPNDAYGFAEIRDINGLPALVGL